MPLQPYFHEYDPAQTVTDLVALENGLRAIIQTRDGRSQPLELRFFSAGIVRVTFGPAQHSNVPELSTLTPEAVQLEQAANTVRLEGSELRAILRLEPFDLRLELLNGTALWRSSQDDTDQKEIGRAHV